VNSIPTPSGRFTVDPGKTTPPVVKWFKPPKGPVLHLYAGRRTNTTGLRVETKAACYLCEPKASTEMDDETVQKKAKPPVAWCKHATEHGGKPWIDLLIPATTGG